MSKTTTFRRRRNGRRALVLTALILLAAALLALGIFGIHALTQTGTPGDNGAPDEKGKSTVPPTTTTTAPPTFSTDALAQLDSSLTAHSVVLYDATHDRMLYAKNETERCAPASLTKLMTAAVAAKYRTDEPFTIGKEVYLRDSQASSAYLKLGMKLTLPQMLDALLLPSGADAAYALAVTTVRRMNPDVEMSNFEAAIQFCDLLNQTAAEIGANDTNFINPDGIYHTNHVTTATDLLTILRFALSFDDVRTAMSLSGISFTTEDGSQLSYKNTDLLLNSRSPYYYPYATGGKTGFTDEAGYCLATTAEKDGVQLMTIVLGCPEEGGRFTDTTVLLNAGFTLVGAAG